MVVISVELVSIKSAVGGGVVYYILYRGCSGGGGTVSWARDDDDDDARAPVAILPPTYYIIILPTRVQKFRLLASPRHQTQTRPERRSKPTVCIINGYRRGT